MSHSQLSPSPSSVEPPDNDSQQNTNHKHEHNECDEEEDGSDPCVFVYTPYHELASQCVDKVEFVRLIYKQFTENVTHEHLQRDRHALIELHTTCIADLWRWIEENAVIAMQEIAHCRVAYQQTQSELESIRYRNEQLDYQLEQYKQHTAQLQDNYHMVCLDKENICMSYQTLREHQALQSDNEQTVHELMCKLDDQQQSLKVTRIALKHSQSDCKLIKENNGHLQREKQEQEKQYQLDATALTETYQQEIQDLKRSIEELKQKQQSSRQMIIDQDSDHAIDGDDDDDARVLDVASSERMHTVERAVMPACASAPVVTAAAVAVAADEDEDEYELPVREIASCAPSCASHVGAQSTRSNVMSATSTPIIGHGGLSISNQDMYHALDVDMMDGGVDGCDGGDGRVVFDNREEFEQILDERLKEYNERIVREIECVQQQQRQQHSDAGKRQTEQITKRVQLVLQNLLSEQYGEMKQIMQRQHDLRLSHAQQQQYTHKLLAEIVSRSQTQRDYSEKIGTSVYRMLALMTMNKQQQQQQRKNAVALKEDEDVKENYALNDGGGNGGGMAMLSEVREKLMALETFFVANEDEQKRDQYHDDELKKLDELQSMMKETHRCLTDNDAHSSKIDVMSSKIDGMQCMMQEHNTEYKRDHQFLIDMVNRNDLNYNEQMKELKKYEKLKYHQTMLRLQRRYIMMKRIFMFALIFGAILLFRYLKKRTICS